MINFRDIVSEGLKLLPEQWREANLLRGLVQSFLEMFQNLFDTFEDVSKGYNVFTAIGYQLDVIGGIVGVPRNGLSDEDYRTEIFKKISVNNSNSTPDTIIEVSQTLSGSSNADIIEGAGTVKITNDTIISAPVLQAIDSAAAAGVRVDGMYSLPEIGTGYFIPAYNNSGTNIVVGTQSFLHHTEDDPQVINPLAYFSSTDSDVPPPTASLDIGGGDFLDVGDGSVLELVVY